MIIKQLSIFLENKSGRLTEVLEVIGMEKINVTALTIADTSEYGILRLVVSDSEKAYQLLKNKGFSVNLTEVLSIETPCEAGSFAKAIKIFSDEGISIEYMYAFSISEKAFIIFKTEDRHRALGVIQKHKLKLVKSNDLFNF